MEWFEKIKLFTINVLLFTISAVMIVGGVWFIHFIIMHWNGSVGFM